MTLSHAIQRDNNNYNLIRLIAALMVIFGHSFSLFPHPGYDEPIRQVFKAEYSGSLAVEIFFFLSGIYITSSFVNSNSPIRFLIMRLCRIWPALIVCILLTVFVVGPILTTDPHYFRSNLTIKYLLFNCTMFYNAAFLLPGVFTNNFLSNAVNGSLWTLPVEIRCYAFIFIIGLCGFFKRGWLIAVLIAVIVILFATNNHILEVMMTSSIAIKLLLFFLAGSLCFAFKEQIIIDYRISLVLIVLAIIFRSHIVVFYFAMLYGILTFGASKIAMKIHLPGDYSYGIYIYGFLVQQIVSHYIVINGYPSMLITIPITTLLAICSWHLIENRAMDFGKKMGKRFAAKKQ